MREKFMLDVQLANAVRVAGSEQRNYEEWVKDYMENSK
jgi:hypothetical protein